MRPQDERNKIQEYVREHRQRRRWHWLTAVLAAVAVAGTTAAMVLPAITMERSPEILVCNLELHTHADSCYDGEGNLICGYADFVVHTHTAECYSEDGTLICPLEEIEVHTHSESCYQETSVLVCEPEKAGEEGRGHVHEESCYGIPANPVCGLEEALPHTHEGHIHTEGCYESTSALICGQKEVQPHVHGAECYDGEGNLACTLSEGGHIHTAECYETQKVLICTQGTGCYDGEGNLACGQSEEGHTHTEACYPETLLCGQEETEAHQHTEACYEVRRELVCGKEEIILHTHTDACYDENGQLICGMLEVREHVHDESCFPAEEDADAGTQDVPVQSGTSWASVTKPGYEPPVQNMLTTFANRIMSAMGQETSRVGESHDFSNEITQVTVERIVDGQWVPATEFVDGDAIRVSIYYSIGDGVITSGNNTMHYQLPAGVGLNNTETGTVYLGNEEPVGTYTIGTDGRIDITFYESFANGEAFSGYLRFGGVISAQDIGEGDQIIFGGTGGTITVKPVEVTYDLQVEKGGTVYLVADGGIGGLPGSATGWNGRVIGYTITVSSPNGTGGSSITVTDTFETANVDYCQESFTYQGQPVEPLIVVKYSAKNEVLEAVTVGSGDLTVSTAQSGSPASFTITNLPALEAGQRYEISYLAIPHTDAAQEDGGLTIRNRATAAAGELTSQAETEVILSPAVVEKTGSYDENSQTITWTITLRNYDGQPIELDDELAWFDADGTKYEIPVESVTADIVVHHEDGTQTTYSDVFMKFPYQIPTEYVALGESCTITYTTSLTELMEAGLLSEEAVKITNTAYNNEYHKGADVEINPPGDYFVVKGNTGAIPNDLNTLQWQSEIHYPSSFDLDPYQMLYLDILEDVYQVGGKTFLGSHYNTVNDLLNNMTLTCGGQTLTYGTDYYIYVVTRDEFNAAFQDSWGGEITSYAYDTLYASLSSGEFVGTMYGWNILKAATELDRTAASALGMSLEVAGGDERLAAFVIQFAAGESLGTKLVAGNFAPIQISYQTHVDTSKVDTVSGTIRATNMAAILSHKAIAWADAARNETFYKEVSPNLPMEKYSEELGTYYDTSSYTSEPITIQTGQTGGLIHYRIRLSGVTSGTETVVDILPAGMELVEGSVLLAVQEDPAYILDSQYTTEGWDSNLIGHTVEKLSDGRTKVTFSISTSQYEWLAGVPLGIYYSVSVANDPDLWQGQTEKTYENTATWKDHTASIHTPIEVTDTVLAKDSVQEIGEDGTVTDVVTYSVTVNPEGRDLHPADDVLELKDVLTLPAGGTAALMLDTVKLYAYDAGAEGHIGQELHSPYFGADYDQDTHTITFTLPDGVACVVVYSYRIDRGTSAADEFKVRNTVELAGQATISAWDDIVIESQGSGAGVNKANLTIYKYGGDDITNLLDGVLFELARFEATETGGYEWRQTSITAAGEDGYYVTGGDGVTGAIILNFLADDEGGGSHYNTLYRLREHETLAGYELDATPRYYVWMESGATPESTSAAMAEVLAAAGVGTDQIDFIAFGANEEEYVQNVPTGIEITAVKRWRSSSGETLTEGLPDRVTVTLRYRAGTSGTFTDYGDSASVELNAGNDWYYTWENLPKANEEGVPYYYIVVETDVPESYEVSYWYSGGADATTGITDGVIAVINTKHSGYVLPETGGTGNHEFVWLGLIFAGAALGGFLIQQIRRKGGRPPLRAGEKS